MNAYTTRGQARIQSHDVSAAMRAYPLIGSSLAALERQRGYQADAEMTWLLKQNRVTQGVTRMVDTPRVSLLRQTIGAALVRAGERLAGVPRGGILLDSVHPADTLGTAG